MKPAWFHRLQRLGKALMVPVAVLPAAGLLIGLGASLPFIPPLVADFLRFGGEAVFALLPLMFAIAVALAFCRQDGIAALAAATGYGTLLAGMAVLAQHFGWPSRQVLGFETLDTGVVGGILVGLMTAWTYRTFRHHQLPEVLGFFSGPRLVPLLNVPFGMVLALVLAALWPPLARWIEILSQWALYQQPTWAWGLYGTVERLLIPLGLHHIWNIPFYFEIGSYADPSGKLVQGEVARFLAGDPDAGHLAGGYLVKVFGLPAAALAICHCAEPAQRARVGTLMLSAAVISALTGITEPVEFAFLFVAPGLFLLHALLTGLAYVMAIALGIHHGMVFSQGLMDFVLYGHLGQQLHHFLWLGPLVSLVYYGAFRAAIQTWQLPTPGRGAQERRVAGRFDPSGVLLALGGRANLKELDACLTRLRLAVYKPERVDEAALTQAGARAVVRHGNAVQVVVGPRAEHLRGLLMAELER